MRLLASLMALAPPRRHARWMVLLALVTAVAFWFTEQSHLLSGYSSKSAAKDPWEWMEGNDAMVPSVHDLDDYGAEPIKAASKGRILITGGGGVIGKQVISRLLSTNTPITVLDKVFFDNELEALKRQHPKASLRFIEGDIRDPAALAMAMTKDVSGVIHLAAVSRVLWCLENEKDCEDVNVRGTQLILDALPKRSWFIQASSREVYGNPKQMPVPEEAPHAPANAYGKTKAKAENVVNAHVKEVTEKGKDINAIILRLSNVYGSAADHRERLIPSIMTNALAHRPIQIVGGDQNLDMINIRDVVNAIAAAVNRLNELTYGAQRTKGEVEVFNIGTSSLTPVMELIRKILWLTNSSSPIQTLAADNRFPNRYEGKTHKATNVLGFTANVKMEDGLHSLARQYLDETYQFLKRKQMIDCVDPPKYSIEDVLFLDGCIGVLAAEYDGRPVYAYYDPPKDGNPESSGWRDDDAPTSWKFDIKKHGRNQATLKMTRHVKIKKDDEAIEYDVPFKANGPDTPISMADTFVVEVDPDTGHVSLTDLEGNPIAPTEKPKTIPMRRRNYFTEEGAKSSFGKFRFRLTPVCCAGKPAPWPFFREDPLASNVLDLRHDTMHWFNASRITTLCRRLNKAEEFTKDRLDKLASDPRPIRLDLAPLPTGRPADWRFRHRDICPNLCDHPTICLDTGDCACAQPACVRRGRFPFSEFANLPYLSFPPQQVEHELGVPEDKDPMVLVNAVGKASWLNVLHPHARRYFNSNPSWPGANVTRMPEDREDEFRKDQEHYERVQTEYHGCFSADSALERGTRQISHPYEKGDIVFLPHYSWVQQFPPIGDWVKNAVENHLPKGFDTADMVVPFTFDWGRCQTVLNRLYAVRQNSFTPAGTERIMAWQTIGDTNSQCYYMDQDIVIPARTCKQEDLRTAFGDLKNVKPSQQRGLLAYYKGSPNGAGTSIREKIACDREWYSGQNPRRMKLAGAEKLPTMWQKLKKANPDPNAEPNPTADYIETIGDSVFCVVPRGTTGWSTRPVDAMYAGCIPVIVGDMTHFPFWDVLDWSKFSIQVDDRDVDHLEEVLTSYTWDEVAQLQTNLMLIRDAILYPNEGHMNELQEYRSPWFFAIHSTWLLQNTKFPTN